MLGRSEDPKERGSGSILCVRAPVVFQLRFGCRDFGRTGLVDVGGRGKLEEGEDGAPD